MTGLRALIRDPWAGSEDCYAGAYRDQFEQLADSLSTPDQHLRARFNPRDTHVELYASSGAAAGTVMASVRIFGEACVPYQAEVWSPHFAEQLPLFTLILGLPVSHVRMDLVP
ncbi:MAG TPA: hypothetical protein VFL98_00395 [Candidatus Paceibacterota bacterium]|nr:hypothetical protein [Candidatus Paceibacterota bacterium]